MLWSCVTLSELDDETKITGGSVGAKDISELKHKKAYQQFEKGTERSDVKG